MKTKKIVSLLLAVMMLVSLLAACSSKTSTEAASASTTADASKSATSEQAAASASSASSSTTTEKKKLVYWAQWAENETQATVLKAGIEKFEKENPDYTVEVNWAGREVSKVLKTSLDSGIQIDIVEGSHDFIPSQIGPDYLADITQYVDGTDMEANMLPAMKLFAKSFAPDGTSWYYIPEQPFIGAIFYNKDIFTKAGITTLPTTWAEFLDCCQKIKDAGYDPMTIDDAYVSTLYGQYLGLMKGQDWVGDLMTDKTGDMWGDPAVLQMAKDWSDFAAKGYFSSTVGSNVFPAAQNGEFAVGTAAMYFNGSWVPNEVASITGDSFNWGVMYLPAPEGAQYDYTSIETGCQMFAVTKSCKDPAAAVKLLECFLSVDIQQQFADVAQCIPVVQGCTWPKNLADVEVVMNEATNTFLWEAMTKQDADIKPIVNDTFSQLIGGKISAEDFVSTLQSKIG